MAETKNPSSFPVTLDRDGSTYSGKLENREPLIKRDRFGNEINTACGYCVVAVEDFDWPADMPEHVPRGCQYIREDVGFVSSDGLWYCQFHAPLYDGSNKPTAKLNHCRRFGINESEEWLRSAIENGKPTQWDATNEEWPSDRPWNLSGVQFGSSVRLIGKEIPTNYWVNTRWSSAADFSGSEFGGAATVFEGALFLGIETSFEDAKFRSANTDFSNTRFDCFRANFLRTEFASRSTSFYESDFRGEVSEFSHALFRGSLLQFGRANFGCSRTKFIETKFRCDAVIFEDTRFLSDTDFIESEFQAGIVDFSQARFEGSNTSFSGASFRSQQDQELTASDTDAAAGADGFGARFTDAIFDTKLDFSEVAVIGDLYLDHYLRSEVSRSDTADGDKDGQPRFGIPGSFHEVNCIDSLIHGSARFHNRTFNHETDFRRTVFGKAPEFMGATLHPDTHWDGVEDQFLERNGRDAEKAYRILRLASEQIRDRLMEGIFFSLEQQAWRGNLVAILRDDWLRPAIWWEYILSWLYQATSRYGRSLTRPIISLAAIFVLFGFVYFAIHSPAKVGSKEFGDYAGFSAQQLVAPLKVWDKPYPADHFVAGAGSKFEWRGLRMGYASLGYRLLATLQSLLYAAATALFILALRWRFRRG